MMLDFFYPLVAVSEVFEKTKTSVENVIIFMPEISQTHKGGTMRLASKKTLFRDEFKDISIVRKLYDNVDEIHERHRHRYEVNPEYVDRIQEKGMMFVGTDDKVERMIIMELKGLICPL